MIDSYILKVGRSVAKYISVVMGLRVYTVSANGYHVYIMCMICSVLDQQSLCSSYFSCTRPGLSQDSV